MAGGGMGMPGNGNANFGGVPQAPVNGPGPGVVNGFARQNVIVAQGMAGEGAEVQLRGLQAGASHRIAGLSLPIAIPEFGQKLVFSKPGGDPKLAISVRPEETVQSGLAWLWAALWTLVVAGGCWALSRPGFNVRLLQALPVLLAILSGLGFLTLAAPFNVLSLAVFVVASIWFTVGSKRRVRSAIDSNAV